VELLAAGERVEDGAGGLVLRRDPGRGLGRRTVLEPAVRVGDLDAVQDVDDVVPARRRRGRDVQRRALAAPAVGLAAVVRLLAAGLVLLLDGALRHGGRG
jgi:hypothetical protein